MSLVNNKSTLDKSAYIKDEVAFRKKNAQRTPFFDGDINFFNFPTLCVKICFLVVMSRFLVVIILDPRFINTFNLNFNYAMDIFFYSCSSFINFVIRFFCSKLIIGEFFVSRVVAGYITLLIIKLVILKFFCEMVRFLPEIKKRTTESK
ncbi:hypothetical protein BpHYR1_032738 [Brachionus plicatilis]|uniref:Uncharacterized protein n=1 Tax=Brachionus plicatilis TaxID=10195 RepID=A0A3M7T3J4_BRAPC|nr:hypothetical protein BpHYR1_032738 [Brachionus plicatilis]